MATEGGDFVRGQVSPPILTSLVVLDEWMLRDGDLPVSV